jgi:hypothetical protein
VSILFILWLFFVLASFFAVQKPFSAANALAFGRVLLDLIATGWLILIATALGTWLLQRLLPAESPLTEALILGAGLGLGALGLLGLLLGLLGLFRPTLFYIMTFIMTVALLPQIVRLFRQVRQWRPANPPNLLIGLYLVIVVALTLLVALLPPTDWDGLFYHLTGPKLHLQAGRIAAGIDIPHLNFPSLMEMLFAWATLLWGDISAKLLHTFFGLLLAGLVYLTARRFLGKKPAWLAVVVFTSMPMVGTLAGWAYNDLALAFFQLATIYAIINYQLVINIGAGRQSEETGRFNIKNSQFTIQNSKLAWLILSGIFAGLAMGMKYTSFVTPLVVSGIIIWNYFRMAASRSQVTGDKAQVSPPKFLRGAIIDLLIFALATGLVAGPWYLKNWTFTGNPVYPFLYDLFGGLYWDSFRAEWYAAAGTGAGFRPTTLLALPWLLTLGIRDANYWDGRTGPLILLFLPLVLLYAVLRYRLPVADKNSTEEPQPLVFDSLLIFALAQFVFWMLGVIWSRSLWQSRLLLTCLVALAPVIGWIWANLSRLDLPNFSLSRFVNLAIGVTLALTIIDIGLLTLKIDPLPYLTGLETRDQFLTRRLGTHYGTIQQLNDVLPAEAVVVFLWEPRSYYCQPDCRPDSILDAFPHLVYQYGSAEAIAQAWRDSRVTHVLIHRSGLNFVLNDTPAAIETDILQDLEAEHLRQLFDVGQSYQLYALEPAP